MYYYTNLLFRNTSLQIVKKTVTLPARLSPMHTNDRSGTGGRKAGDKKSGKCATFSFLAHAL